MYQSEPKYLLPIYGENISFLIDIYTWFWDFQIVCYIGLIIYCLGVKPLVWPPSHLKFNSGKLTHHLVIFHYPWKHNIMVAFYFITMRNAALRGHRVFHMILYLYVARINIQELDHFIKVKILCHKQFNLFCSWQWDDTS